MKSLYLFLVFFVFYSKYSLLKISYKKISSSIQKRPIALLLSDLGDGVVGCVVRVRVCVCVIVDPSHPHTNVMPTLKGQLWICSEFHKNI